MTLTNNLLAYKAVLKALSSVYQVSVACNDTDNACTLLENDGFVDEKFTVNGKYDKFISKCAELIPNEEQRNEITSAFSSDGLISAWNNGKDRVAIEYQMLDASGKLHWVETTAIKVDDPDSKDYLHVMVLQVIDDRKGKEIGLKEELEKSNEDLNISRKISILSNKLTKSGTIICIYDIKNRVISFPSWYAEKYNISASVADYPNADDEQFAKSFINKDELEKYLKIFEDISRGISTEEAVVGVNSYGGRVWYKIKSAIVKDDDGRNINAVISMDDITDDYNKEQIHKKEIGNMQAMISTVSQKDIVYLGTINVSTKMCYLYTKTDNNRVSIPDEFEYDELIREFSSKYVDEADRQDYLNNMLLDAIIKGIDAEGIYINQYTLMM